MATKHKKKRYPELDIQRTLQNQAAPRGPLFAKYFFFQKTIFLEQLPMNIFSFSSTAITPSTVAATKPKVSNATTTSSVASQVRSTAAMSTARKLTKPKRSANPDKPHRTSSRTSTSKATSPIKSTSTISEEDSHPITAACSLHHQNKISKKQPANVHDQIVVEPDVHNRNADVSQQHPSKFLPELKKPIEKLA